MPLRVEQLLDEAVRATGLDDFGDPSFRVGLEMLVASLVDEAALTDLGAAIAARQLTGWLTARLRVEDHWHAHPELDAERVVRPVCILGMSRSGTTALSHLLARDPANRSLLGWEASEPIPPPRAESWATDPRFEVARAQEFGAMHELNPEFAAIHHDPPDLPVECVVIMAQHFVSLSPAAQYVIPTYTRWLLDLDHRPVYAWHDRVLRVLQSGGVRGRWQLKSPHHALALDALDAQYPDARFVVTHRDPAVCVASTASLVRSLSGTFAHGGRERELGELWSEVLATMTDRLVAARTRLGEDRFVDVAYSDLVADPVGTAQRIYAALEWAFTDAAADAMIAHANVAVPGRHGRHTYRPGDFALDRDALAERFAAYRARFAEYLA
jgi:hypothetical protein